MKKIKNLLLSPKTTVVALVVAIGLLAFSTIGGARAALTYYSDTYQSQVETKDIGVTLVENEVDIAFRDYVKEKADGTWHEQIGVLLGNMLPTSQTQQSVSLGQLYPESLWVKNSGTIDQYVRVTIYKYWMDEQGNKTRVINPDAIDLHLINLLGDPTGEQCWIEDAEAKTEERTVLYYNKLLPNAEITPAFTDTLKIDVDLEEHSKVTRTDEGVIITTSEFNGYRFAIEVTVDAVQDHNAKEAILSAWGKNVSIQNKTLGLN